MRADALTFALLDQAPAREPRFVVRIEFDVSSPYITSHTDITGVPGAVIYGALQKPSAISQRIVPDEGRSEIGSFTFSLVDTSGDFTTAIRSQLQVQLQGLRGRVVRFYVGYKGMDFSQFVLFQTQIVFRCTYRRGVYEVVCADITRELRKEVFRPVSTTLRDSITDTSLTIPVYDTSQFEMIAHGAAYTDLPSATRGYVRIEQEIIRYNAKSADTFTVDGASGRGALNTKAAAHAVDIATTADRRTKVEEYIYLEGPGPQLAYAVQTGILYGTANTLPDHWHLGIDPSFVRLSDFTSIGPDLWDTTDESKGLIFRFEGLQARDGKQFIEKELYLLLACYSPVYSDGTLGLRRMVGVISDAAPVLTLTEDEIIDLSPLEHDYQSLHNDFRINWAFEPIANDFLRTTGFFDAESIDIHGRAPLLTYEFHGLHSGRATDSTIALRLDAIRDRYSQPPQTINATVFGSLNRIEVGDILRLQVPESILRDFAGEAGEYNRSFEVQQKTYNATAGTVELELFGSTARPDALPTTPTAVTPLPDAFYSSAGSLLSSVVTITSGTAMPGSYLITGNASLGNSASIYYYIGDLTIASGCNITLAANVQLRVMGFLTINGTITGTGGGLAGVSDPGTLPWDTAIAGNAGFFGSSRGWDGLQSYGNGGTHPIIGLKTVPIATTRGLYDVVPFFSLKVSGNELLGLPLDLRGTGGAPGGRYSTAVSVGSPTFGAAGGTGAAGGAGLCIICRGAAPGAGASITLNGSNSAATSPSVVFGKQIYPGSGGAGAPGACLLLLDGNTLSIPVLTGKFFALTGTVGQLGTPLESPQIVNALAGPQQVEHPGPFAGFESPAVISGLDFSNSALRIQYIPVSEDTNDDVDPSPPPPSGLSASRTTGGNLVKYTIPDLDTFDVIEIWSSIDNNRGNSNKAGETRGTSFVEHLPLGGLRYYWARSKINPVNGRPPLYSDWERSSATDGVSSNADTPGETPDAPSEFTATGKVNGIQFNWSLPAFSRLLGKVQLYQHTASTPFSAATLVWEGYGLGYFLTQTSAAVRYYWIVLNRSDELSVPEPAVVGLAGAPSSTTSTLVASAFPTSLDKTASLSSNPVFVMTVSTTVTASGGTGPYTYAWTWLSGGTGITIDASTLATTTFSGSNNLDGTTKTGTARCTVTDSLLATTTSDVTVQLHWPSIA